MSRPDAAYIDRPVWKNSRIVGFELDEENYFVSIAITDPSGEHGEFEIIGRIGEALKKISQDQSFRNLKKVGEMIRNV